MSHPRTHRLLPTLFAFAALTVLGVGPVSATVCPADVTGDNVVGTPDQDFLLACWGAVSAGSFCAVADLDVSGAIDGADLGQLVASWGACPSPSCPWDLNEDDQVDTVDQDMLLACWGPVKAGSVCAGADFDDSGAIGGADLAIVLGQWGSCP